MKTDFVEDFVSEHADSLDGQHIEFDFDEIDRLLSGVREELGEEKFAMLGNAWLKTAQHLVRTSSPVRKGFDALIGRRLMGFLWCIRPDLFPGTPSLTELARKIRCNKVVLSLPAADTSRAFGIRNRAQSHGWNFNKGKHT